MDINTLKNIGEFNGWKGNICLYFSKKKLRELKSFGITEEMTIKQAFEHLNSHENQNIF